MYIASIAYTIVYENFNVVDYTWCIQNACRELGELREEGLEEESATDLEEKEPNEERHACKVCKPLPSSYIAYSNFSNGISYSLAM